MLEKKVVIDGVEVAEDGTVRVRRATYILENGVRIAGPFDHHVAIHPPGTDVMAETTRVRAVAQAVWTPDVVAAYRARQDDAK